MPKGSYRFSYYGIALMEIKVYEYMYQVPVALRYR